MITTIHQPDFFPWIGFFNKIANADQWVVLDHTENNPRDSAFWGRRVAILLHGRAHWLTITLEKPSSGQVGVPILEMEVKDTPQNPLGKVRATIESAYSKAPFYEEYRYIVDLFFDHESAKLVDRNMAVIEALMKVLAIDTPIVRSSALGIESRSTKLLVDIIGAVGAHAYLCGGGASGYQNDELFADAGVQLVYNGFSPEPYEQRGVDSFVGGLSLLDALFRIPTDQLRDMVHRRHFVA